MSKTLKGVVESGRNVVESGASTLSDLVDEARSRIEDLPPLARPRKRRARRRWGSILVLGLLAVPLWGSPNAAGKNRQILSTRRACGGAESPLPQRVQLRLMTSTAMSSSAS